jgi:hypothetical protein
MLTLDYEICGNGSGDVLRDIIQPTARLLDLCDKHNAHMTVMFEVGEYLAFARYDEQLQADLGYSPHEQMREQAKNVIRRGHDVQLHLHPQWLTARYDAGVWRFDSSRWRLTDLPVGSATKDEVAFIAQALATGKSTLENMLGPVKEDYECVCFRAGSFCAQPSRNLIRAMKRVGLKVDSSVVRGYRAPAPLAVDYSHVEADAAAWWTSEAELTAEGKPGENVLELSVSSRMVPYWRSLTPTKFRAAARMRRIEKEARKNHSGTGQISSLPTCGQVLKRLLKKRSSPLDFCKLTAKDMLNRFREHVEDRQEQPIVAIGHSKDFVNDRELNKFLADLGQEEFVRCCNMSDYVREVLPPLADAQVA